MNAIVVVAVKKYISIICFFVLNYFWMFEKYKKTKQK